MVLAVLVVVVAALAARIDGGRLATLAAAPFRGRRLVAIAIVAQLLGSGLAAATGQSAWYAAGLVLGAAAGFAFCVRNRRVAGVPLVTLGLAANAVVVLVNGAMPVSADAAARAGVAITTIAARDDPRHVVARPGTTWRALGDVVPVPLPGRPEVVSPGDVLIAAGLGELVLLGMSPRRRQRRGARQRTAVAWSGNHADAVSHAATARVPRPNTQGELHGKEEAQGPGPQEEQGQPRQAPELLARLTPR